MSEQFHPFPEWVVYQPLGELYQVRLSVPVVQRYLCEPSKNGTVCDERQAIRFMLFCRGRQLDPFAGEALLTATELPSEDDGPPQFTITITREAYLKRAALTEAFERMESGIVVRTTGGKVEEREGMLSLQEEVLLGGWARVHVKNKPQPVQAKVSLAACYQENRLWRRDPAGMVLKCAEARALLQAFPVLFAGMDEEISPAPAASLTGGCCDTRAVSDTPGEADWRSKDYALMVRQSASITELARVHEEASLALGGGFALDEIDNLVAMRIRELEEDGQENNE